MQARSRKSRRTANACIACRQSKIKCSGNEPCINCQRRGVPCEFAEGVNRIVVSERYLRHLERLVRGRDSLSGVKSSPSSPIEVHNGPKDKYSEGVPQMPHVEFPAAESSPVPTGHARSIWTSPFALPSTTIKNTKDNKRKWIWLAPSSMWSFTTRLTIMMTEKLHREYPHNAPTLLETEIYPLRWDVCSVHQPPDISGLPSLDYALYLFQTVKFHLGQSYRFFDEETFLKNLHIFYHGNAAQRATEYRLWFIQFLLVISFGTALLSRAKGPEAPGSRFFVRAMSLMPDHASLWRDSLLAIEVLAMAGLYLYSVDQRESAHIYLGQAIRIAQFEGLHTQLPEDQLGAETVSRCRNLWWTLYIMDRHFSYSVGLPMTTQDTDISTLIDPPNTCSHRDVALTLQAKLSHLMSFILTTVYKTEKTQLGTFLDTTRSILHTLAGYAQEVEDIIHVRLRNSVDTLPKGTRHITLLYHQCVIVATRPLLLSALMERLENLDHEREDWQDFLALTKTLISTGIKSAVKTLQILSNKDNLLEVFLLYDLEYAYAAALHVAMADAVFPHVVDGQVHRQEAHSILGEMICNGNKVAEVRKSELVYLESLFQELASRVETRGLQPLTLSTPNGLEAGQNRGEREEVLLAEPEMMALPMGGYSQSPHSVEVQMPSVEFLDNIGISSADFLSIVDQMGNTEVSSSILNFGHNEEEM